MFYNIFSPHIPPSPKHKKEGRPPEGRPSDYFLILLSLLLCEDYYTVPVISAVRL